MGNMVINIPGIIAVSMAIVGLIFFMAAVIISASFKSAKRNSKSAYGTLVCFRKYNYAAGADDGYHRYADNPHEDYPENIANSRPVVRFLHNGNDIIRYAEYPNPRLSGGDIGKQFKIRYTENLKVYFDDEDSRKNSDRIQKRLFWILTGIAIALFILGLAAALIIHIFTIFVEMGGMEL